MTIYIALVGMANLLLGFLLAWLLFATSESAVACRTVLRFPGQRGVRNAAIASVAAARAAPPKTNPKPAPASKAATSKANASRTEASGAPAPSAALKGWTDAAHELRQIRERIGYAKNNRDKTLLKQVAAQLETWATAWQARLLECIDHPEAAPQEVMNGADVSEFEMQAAQTETTLSNLKSLDWAEGLDELVPLLQREIEALDRNRCLRNLAMKARPAS